MTKESIVDAAFAMIDERGNEGFSMRSLATELGVFPATLYWHVGDRAQLLGLVLQQWMDSIEVPEVSDDWAGWMRETSRGYRRSAHRHPQIARLVGVERSRNTDTLVLPDKVLGVIESMGFAGERLAHAFNTVMGAVMGFVMMELSPVWPDPEARDDARRELEALDPERFPHISANFDVVGDRVMSLRWTDASEQPLDESFEFLLDVLVAGIASQLPPR